MWPGQPQGTEHVDRFRGRAEGLVRAAQRAAQAGDLRPGAAGAQAELEPAAGQQVQAGAGLGQHLRWPQRQVGDVGQEPDPVRLADERADEREGVEKVRYIGVILHRDEVEARLFCGVRVVTEPPDPGGTGAEEHPELQSVHDASRLIIHVTTSHAAVLHEPKRVPSVTGSGPAHPPSGHEA